VARENSEFAIGGTSSQIQWSHEKAEWRQNEEHQEEHSAHDSHLEVQQGGSGLPNPIPKHSGEPRAEIKLVKRPSSHQREVGPVLDNVALYIRIEEL